MKNMRCCAGTENDVSNEHDDRVVENVWERGTYVYKGGKVYPRDKRYITHVKIDASVTIIHDQAFELCSSLRTIKLMPSASTSTSTSTSTSAQPARTLPTKSTLIQYQELHCNLQEIGSRAFYGCSNLTTIVHDVFPQGNNSSSSSSSSSSSNNMNIFKIRSVVENELKENESNEKVGTNHLNSGDDDGNSKNIRVSYYTYSLRRIGKRAFEGCSSLTGVLNFPPSVQVIEKDSFYECSSLTGLILPTSLRKLGPYTFGSCENLQFVTFSTPCQLRVIPKCAFAGCESLLNLILPDNDDDDEEKEEENRSENDTRKVGIQRVETGAFFGCGSLMYVDFPRKSLQEISKQAFFDCSSLKGIHIPESVKSIGQSAFEMCSDLSFVRFHHVERYSSVCHIGAKAFRRCVLLRTIRLPRSNGKRKSSKETTGLTRIQAETFEDCVSLESIQLPDSLESIENSAFFGCTSLKIIDYVGATIDSPFEGEANLREDSVMSYYRVSHAKPSSSPNHNNVSTKGLVSLMVRFPTSLKFIGAFAFGNCNWLVEKRRRRRRQQQRRRHISNEDDSDNDDNNSNDNSQGSHDDETKNEDSTFLLENSALHHFCDLNRGGGWNLLRYDCDDDDGDDEENKKGNRCHHPPPVSLWPLVLHRVLNVMPVPVGDICANDDIYGNNGLRINHVDNNGTDEVRQEPFLSQRRRRVSVAYEYLLQNGSLWTQQHESIEYQQQISTTPSVNAAATAAALAAAATTTPTRTRATRTRATTVSSVAGIDEYRSESSVTSLHAGFPAAVATPVSHVSAAPTPSPSIDPAAAASSAAAAATQLEEQCRTQQYGSSSTSVPYDAMNTCIDCRCVIS